MNKGYKRWYDYDPMLLEVIEMLRYYQDELKEQAKIFLEKVEKQAGKHGNGPGFFEAGEKGRLFPDGGQLLLRRRRPQRDHAGL